LTRLSFREKLSFVEDTFPGACAAEPLGFGNNQHDDLGIVTAILMAVHHNVGIPIATAFAIAETVDLCEQLCLVFSERFELDLSQ
jgi:hypothetical protein